MKSFLQFWQACTELAECVFVCDSIFLFLIMPLLVDNNFHNKLFLVYLEHKRFRIRLDTARLRARVLRRLHGAPLKLNVAGRAVAATTSSVAGRLRLTFAQELHLAAGDELTVEVG